MSQVFISHHTHCVKTRARPPSRIRRNNYTQTSASQTTTVASNMHLKICTLTKTHKEEGNMSMKDDLQYVIHAAKRTV